MTKKIISILLVLCMVGCLLTINVSAASVMNGKHGADFADGALAERLEVIFYSGISGCVSPSIPAVGGTLNNSTIYTTTFSNMSGSKRDYQCAAYARAAYSYLFGYDMGESSYRVEFTDATGRSSLSYALFAQYGVRCGAYIRTTNSASGAFNGSVGHSMIILSYDSNGVTTLEGNYNGSGGIGILYYTWNQFNQGQLSGRGRYVCSFSQPTASIYASVTSTPAPCTTHTKGTFLFCELAHPHYNYFTCSVCGATFTDGTTTFVDYCTQCTASAGQTSAPRVAVIGQSVAATWTYSGNAASFDVYLVQEPWRWEDIQYHISTQSTFCTFSNVAAGTYRVFVIARPNADTVQSEWTEVTVAAPHTEHSWDAGAVTTEPTLMSSGIKTYTCTVCGVTKTETISALSTITVDLGRSSILLANTGELFVRGSGQWGYLLKNIRTDEFYMGDYADFVTSITVEEGISSIQGSVGNLPNIVSINLPNSLTSIQSAAFSFSPKLTAVTIPKNVSNISPFGVFLGCTSLTSINVDGENHNYTSQDGVLYNKELTSLYTFPYGRSGNFVVPDSVTYIGRDSFAWAGLLNSVTIPASVTEIAENAFVDNNYIEIGYPSTFQGKLRVYSGSYAESYAKEHSLNYEVINVCADGHTWDAGSVTITPTAVSEGAMTYTCTVCGATKTEPIPVLTSTSVSKFLDVATGEFYTDAVAWAVENGVTTGVDSSHFAPNDTCTRAQIVTFLWRAAGQPEPASMQNSFTDVGTGDYYYKSVLWAAENGITSGTDATHFSPSENCTRAQAVTFLWRAAGQPATETGNSFLDIPALSFYHGAVNWAVSRGITSGVSSSSFAPDNICTRAQIVTFLYRYMKF